MNGNGSRKSTDSAIRRARSEHDLVTINGLQGLFETAGEFGCDLANELAAFGITKELIDESFAYVRLRDVGKILELTSHKTGRSDFALVLGTRQNLSDANEVVLLARTATTLRQAFLKMSKFKHTYAPPVHWRIESNPHADSMLCSIEGYGLTPEQHRLCAELILTQTYKFVSDILGAPPKLERVYFAYSRGHKTIPYSRFFRSPIEFDAEYFGLEFEQGTFDKKLVYANKDLHTRVEQNLTAPERLKGVHLDQKVGAVIRSLMPTNTLSADRVARAFGCSARTLQRRLKSECGVTYSAILADVRIDVSQQLLAQTNVSVTELSLIMGFTDPSNFSHDFKRRLGCSPREWRKKYRSGLN